MQNLSNKNHSSDLSSLVSWCWVAFLQGVCKRGWWFQFQNWARNTSFKLFDLKTRLLQLQTSNAIDWKECRKVDEEQWRHQTTSAGAFNVPPSTVRPHCHPDSFNLSCQMTEIKNVTFFWKFLQTYRIVSSWFVVICSADLTRGSPAAIHFVRDYRFIKNNRKQMVSKRVCFDQDGDIGKHRCSSVEAFNCVLPCVGRTYRNLSIIISSHSSITSRELLCSQHDLCSSLHYVM